MCGVCVRLCLMLLRLSVCVRKREALSSVGRSVMLGSIYYCPSVSLSLSVGPGTPFFTILTAVFLVCCCCFLISGCRDHQQRLVICFVFFHGPISSARDMMYVVVHMWVRRIIFLLSNTLSSSSRIRCLPFSRAVCRFSVVGSD